MSVLYQLENVGLTSSTGADTILAEISLQLKLGEFVGLIGSSGSGKSSLFRLMNRLKEPTTGKLSFKGRSIDTMDPCEVRRQIMLVGQESHLLNMTVRQALHYPLKLQKLDPNDQAARVNYWVDRCQIPKDWLEKTELQLSGGQLQQVAIVRALITEPSLLLLDEPTSALDVGSANRILAVIEQQVHENKLSVFMSNHQLEIAQALCDRVVYIEQGRIHHDLPRESINWQKLRQSLVLADAKNHQAW